MHSAMDSLGGPLLGGTTYTEYDRSVNTRGGPYSNIIIIGTRGPQNFMTPAVYMMHGEQDLHYPAWRRELNFELVRYWSSRACAHTPLKI